MASPLLVIFFLIISSPFSCSTRNTLKKGSSISIEDVLISPNGQFTAGFYKVGENAYCFSIWFTHSFTVVWMANRDIPVNGRLSKLSFLKTGNLILSDAGTRGTPVWATNTASFSPLKLELHDDGNLLLLLDHVPNEYLPNDSRKSSTLWESFGSPTDTLLPTQLFKKDMQLVSSRSGTNYSTGFYKFYFDNDNVLRLLYSGPEISSVFWPDPGALPWEEQRSTYNSNRLAMLDLFGNFSATDNFTFSCADYGDKTIQRRLKLEFDGNLRLYSREKDESWIVSWQLTSQPCSIHGICGPNSVCSYHHESGRKCSCIPGFELVNDENWSFGCKPKFNLSCDTNDQSHQVIFLQLQNVEFYGYDFGFFPNMTFDDCKNKCLERCDCKGFQFKFVKHDHPSDLPYCFAKTMLLNGQRTPNFKGDLYLKLPKLEDTRMYNWPLTEFKLDTGTCSNFIHELPRKYAKTHEIRLVKLLFWFVTILGALEFFIIFSVWIFFIVRNKTDRGIMQGYYLQAASGFKRYSYSELKKATRNFKQVIGKGAGGIVYKGTFSDDRVAAIKLLNEAHQGEEEFLAEISSIGKLNHMNLIDMWGYCTETTSKHKLLVYEYMEHGSLAVNINSIQLDWKRRFDIAVGTAKGLAYLHEECLEWILHCDVKPHNILLDNDYQPKVSDFGLSRLVSRSIQSDGNQGFSQLRGTRGYMAPEWISNLPITSKVDVYSYGIVVLEMLTGRSPTTSIEEDTGGLVAWTREKRSQAVGTVEYDWIKEIINPRIGNEYEIKKLGKMVEVALRCVEEDKDARPTMSQVVEMLLTHENS
ncbi:G-type lectin S-receptor-like serine/threonine-protein kinase At2g19130 [Euphorbia peplus]|nr:G-type lectin S-receptor-like serine/threonine-protein kinase At2g19130 [Euphorbia peplus]